MLKWAHNARKLDIGLLCLNMEIRPRAPKTGNFQKIFIFVKDLQISLPTSPQPPPDIKFKSSYAENMILAYYAQIWKFGPRFPKMEFFKEFLFL